MHPSMKKSLIVANEGSRHVIERRFDDAHKDKRYLTYDYAKTAEQWWEIVDGWWDNLSLLLEQYLPMDKPVEQDNKIVAVTLREHIILLKQSRDSELATWFGRAWGNAPDSGYIHGQKAWDVLCDLCSESYVLYEEGN